MSSSARTLTAWTASRRRRAARSRWAGFCGCGWIRRNWNQRTDAGSPPGTRCTSPCSAAASTTTWGTRARNLFEASRLVLRGEGGQRSRQEAVRTRTSQTAWPSRSARRRTCRTRGSALRHTDLRSTYPPKSSRWTSRSSSRTLACRSRRRRRRNEPMKYAIIIPDGAADEPLAELGGKTPLEAAQTPNMDRVAMEGRQGLARTVPDGFESGSDVATMMLLGYDPKVYHTGRAPLEAAAQQHPAVADRLGLPLQPRHRRRRDHEGPLGRRDQRRRGAEADRRPVAVAEPGGVRVPHRRELPQPARVPRQRGRSTSRPSRRTSSRRSRCARYLPRGQGSGDPPADHGRVARAVRATTRSTRSASRPACNPATQVWLWGQGHAPNMPTFERALRRRQRRA